MRAFCPEYRTLIIIKSESIWQPTIKDVTDLLKKHKVRYSGIVLSQAILESGYLRGDILKANKNLFGMRYAPTRKTTAIGDQFGCAVYSSIEESVKDYKIWQELYFRSGDYYAFLKRIGYAEDGKYIEKLKQLLNKY